ncbi:MAG: MBL fold metallo-hydrolase [Firmicutes bacterium]|jgi:L-ascorbate metabolism protein UlaG (beta-lactamase superfamily)|nr:MBL fold metallo-hydrolase [Bacillota bacterium]
MQLKWKWFGTATILMSVGDSSVIFDPFVSMNDKINAYNHAVAADARAILITHGHFDHLVDVPDLVKKYGQDVYCAGVAAQTLRREGMDAKKIKIVSPGDRFEIGDFKFTVWRSRHIVFDLKLILKTAFNRRVFDYGENLGKIIGLNRKYPKGEVLLWEIEAAGKRILHMGSLSLAPDVAYPQGVDLLTIPLQGRSDLNDFSMPILQRLKPRAIYLHHFDDTFPPVSSTVDYPSFVRKVQQEFPSMEVIVPDYGEELVL